MSNLDRCLKFLQSLIQTPSLPGREEEMARLVQAEMRALGYDEVRLDEAGNVIGRIRGQGQVPAVMFNTHLDHVDVGDPGRWPHPPFGGEIHGDRVWGRGAVDIKGPLAAQVWGVARLLEKEIPPPGDVYVTAVVQEEIGGLGARHLVTHLDTPLVIVGEPSSNQVRRGHRGRTEAVLHVRGRSVHASVPERGVNPLQVTARFIRALEGLEMRAHEDLGSSSVALTLIRTDQTSPNVVPAEAWLTCDWRNVPGETGEEIEACLNGVARQSLIEGASARVSVPVFSRTSYSGLQMDIPSDNPAFVLKSDHPAVRAAQGTLVEAIGLEAEPGVWQFATDGGHFALAGQTCVGFGPGDETLAHTVQEHIEVAALERALRGNEALALEWAPKVELFRER